MRRSRVQCYVLDLSGPAAKSIGDFIAVGLHALPSRSCGWRANHGRTQAPMGSDLCAAVSASLSNASPLAVRRPW